MLLSFLVIIIYLCSAERFSAFIYNQRLKKLGSSLSLQKSSSSLSSYKLNMIAKSIWSDPKLKWGYADGKGHDYAMALRKKLQTVEQRQGFCESVLQGKVTYDEQTLALALRFQRAAREGKDGCGKGWEIMNKMADCAYEADAGLEELQDDLYTLIDKLPAELSGLVNEMDGIKNAKEIDKVVASALCATDFIDIGL